MSCHRCERDPQPPGFGDLRKCAFSASGEFTPDNWNCATLQALMDGRDDDTDIEGDNQSMQVIPAFVADVDDGAVCYEQDGWIVLTRYKHRGCTSGAVHVGDFYPHKPVTLALCDDVISTRAAMWKREATV